MPATESVIKPEAQVRRWKTELRLADKREEQWRKTGKALWDKYRSKNARKSSFNILWSNTDTLLPALYNTEPKPDVRRRFRTEDKLGKVVSEVLERSLIYSIDASAFPSVARMTVLDALITGRGVSRVRYVPSLMQTLPEPVQTATETVVEDNNEDESTVETEELEYEQAIPDHVDWEDFRHGAARTWDEVPWVAFRCRLNKAETIEKFGEDIAERIKYDAVDDDELKKQENEDLHSTFKSAEFWEIWDKTKKKVCFLNDSIKEELLYPQDNPQGDPPLILKGFFPTPEPLRLVDDSNSLIPIPLYDQYRRQADELDRVSARINVVINALKLRGIYDSTIVELAELFDGDDNKMFPSRNAVQILDRGGLDKAIWMMPVEMAAQVLAELYTARESIKQTIYELTGISDIVRGATDPDETLGAQQLKANYASVRLQKMQREVQRYVRDLVRMTAEIIAEKFQPETLTQMTGMQLMTGQQKQQAMLQAQVISAQGQPVPMELQQQLMLSTWDEVVQLLRSDALREFRIDVETDSTIAASLESDMKGMQEVLTGLSNFWTAVQVPVQSGALPIEAVKAISLSICRRAKMGLEVEDAVEKMQAPLPPQPEVSEEPKKDDESGPKLDAIGQTVTAMAQGQQASDGQYSQALQSMMDAQLQLGQMVQQLGQAQAQMIQLVQKMTLAVASPKRIVRDPNTGRAQGVETVIMQ